MDQPWVSLSAAGLALNIFGLAVTLVGLDELSRELFPHRPLPHRAFTRWLKRVFRRRGQPVTVNLEAATMVVTAGNARPMTTRARPTDDAASAEWAEYWDSRLSNLSDRLDWLAADMKEQNREISGRIKAEARERVTGDESVRQQLLNAVGGREGSGLVKAWWGLAAVVVGTLLQGIAGIIAA